MVDKVLIKNKLNRIETYLKELKAIKAPTYEEYCKNVVLKRFIERNIELAIEQVISICKHIVSRLNLREPASYAECFEILAENQIIERENLEIYKQMAKFRNLLIHVYDKVDDKIVYQVYKERLDDFEVFIEEIKKFFKI